MSETKLATKDDLQEMYQRILPYMGGMPEMLANKFAKGDLYSTSEKMIGQWIDGKPLYQKTVNISNLQKFQAVSLGVTADTLVDSWVRLEDSSYQFTNAVSYYVSGSDYRLFAINKNKSTNDVYYYIACSNDNLITGFTGHITIQYTKTTDSPISIGSDTDYSTDEKIVGTWIDGKPLYQKTLQLNPTKNYPANTTTFDTLYTDESVDELISMKGTITFTYGTYTKLELPYVMVGDQQWNFIPTWNQNALEMRIALKGGSNYTPSEILFVITLQYTKTTD